MVWPTRALQSDAHSGLIGVANALGCFSLWGLFPIYFKLLEHVPALEVLAHRVLWSAVLLLGLVLAQGQAAALRDVWHDHQRLRFYVLTALLISSNWLLYIWAVQQNRILEASLGYYMSPLVNVLLGVWLLHERLNPRQQFAVALALGGVLVLVIGHGLFPWIALILALSFGGYGLLRKKLGHAATLGLCVETMLLAPVAMLGLAILTVHGTDSLTNTTTQTAMLLLAAGPVTVLPLLLFLDATRRLRLSTVGLIQYLTPTFQFLLAVFLYEEPFSLVHLGAFCLIWMALAIYSADALSSYRSPPPESV